MSLITEELFVSLIEAMRLQTVRDREYVQSLEQSFRVTGLPMYDNSALFKSIISLIQKSYPPVEGYCAVEHYCFELNFGKVGEDELITIQDLWHELNNKNLTSTNPFIDDHSRLFPTASDMIQFHSDTNLLKDFGISEIEVKAKCDGYGTFKKPTITDISNK